MSNQGTLEVGNVVVSKELINKPRKLATPRYRYLKTYSNLGTSTISIPHNSRREAFFEIPTNSINYKKSFICGTITAPALNNNYNWRHADAAAFCSAVRFKPRTGASLIDMDYLQNYTKVVNRLETSIEDVMSNDSSDILFSHRGVDAAVGIAKRSNNEPISHPNVEGQYLVVDTTVNHATEWHFKIPLHRFVPNSLFSRTGDIKFPETAILTTHLGPGNRLFFTKNDAADPSAGTALATACDLDNFHLLLAVQDDPIYEAMMEQKLKAGINIPFNYPIASMIDRNGTQQNVSISYNSGHGRSLVRIYHSVFNSTETASTAYDNNNRAIKKVQRYHVKLKDSRTTQFELTTIHTSTNETSAYLYHKELLEGTSITNSDIYLANFTHVEDLGRMGGVKKQKELGINLDTMEVGIPLDQDYKFEFVATTTNAAYNHYTFAIVQRQLTITPTAIVVN